MSCNQFNIPLHSLLRWSSILFVGGVVDDECVVHGDDDGGDA